MTSDVATIHALRADLALQIARHVARSGQTQVAMAARLGIPQPTLSRIANGQVAELSLELLLRIAVRARLPVVLQTGAEPVEAGAYVTGARLTQRQHFSKLGEVARDASTESVAGLSPEQRLEAQLRHSGLLTALQRAARHRQPRRRALPESRSR